MNWGPVRLWTAQIDRIGEQSCVGAEGGTRTLTPEAQASKTCVSAISPLPRVSSVARSWTDGKVQPRGWLDAGMGSTISE